MDAPSAQLHLEIRDAVVKALATRRPILHHLNADTSWLLQIPRPPNAIKHGSRIYYNVLIDPWFVGGQSDVAKWFSQQWHATESAVKSVAEVEELARQVEILAGGIRLGKDRTTNTDAGADVETFVDAVAISHEFTDHCHKDTLLEVHRDVPVFATDKAAELISYWNHFRTVIKMPSFEDGADWRDYSLFASPIMARHITADSSKDALYYHSAVLITFAAHSSQPQATPKKRSSLSINGDGAEDFGGSGSHTDAAECVIYTPHGIPHTALTPIATADPPIQTLAFLHGLHDVSISAAQQLNLGAKNGVLAQKMLKAKYWVATHDEVKKGGGLISWWLRRKAWTLEDALKEARTDLAYLGEGVIGDEFEDVRFQDMANGESRILE